MERFDVREIERAAKAAATAASAATRAATAASAATRAATAARTAARSAKEAASAADIAASATAEAARIAARRNTRSETISPNNGFEFTHNDKLYEIPREMLEIILSHVDHENLLTYHFVCKNWKTLIQDRVWRIKARLTVHENFSHHHSVPWQVYHWICKTNRNPFERNLLNNHSGEDNFDHWKSYELVNWKVENPSVGMPELPVDEDPIFERRQFCFATLDGSKSQTVDLVTAGFHSYILDKFQPPIEMSEWYYCDSEDSIKFEYTRSTDTHNIFSGYEQEEKESKWRKKTNKCVNYGSGLTKIEFLHCGKSFSKINCKMAGACVKVMFPYVTPRAHPSRNE